MAILGNILNNLLNLNEDSSSRTAKPCKNCPSSCELFRIPVSSVSRSRKN